MHALSGNEYLYVAIDLVWPLAFALGAGFICAALVLQGIKTLEADRRGEAFEAGDGPADQPRGHEDDLL